MTANSSHWFRHDSDARDDCKCMLLIDREGLEGYGIFWLLIEILRGQDGYKYPMAMLPILARRYNTSPEKLREVITQYGLFVVRDDDTFSSESMSKRMEGYERMCHQKRISAEAGGKKSGEMRREMKKIEARFKQGPSKAQARSKQGPSKAQANRIERNRIERNRMDSIGPKTKKGGSVVREGVCKGGESAAKETQYVSSAPPSKQETADFFTTNGSTVEEAGKFWYHFDSNGWLVGGRTRMKSWTSAARKWMLDSRTG